MPEEEGATSSEHERHDEPSDPIARRLEERFLDDDFELTESMLEELGDDADEVVRLLVLNEVAEHGLDLLEREGVTAAVDGFVGRRVGDYHLIQEIGSGGMGVLYLAEDAVLDRLVALKILTRQTASATERFRREAEIAASLEHPAIVPVYSRGQHEDVHYIAMRYIAGKDIERTLTMSREASGSGTSGIYARAARWCAAVAEGLEHAHRSGVIHRDVKPSNILIEDDKPFLVDFGLARSEEADTLTMSGDLLGTVPYMSPEQIRSEGDLDGRTDVYSLGATLYQLLAGVVPFAGRSSQAIARQILTRDPAPLRRYGVPRDLEAVVFRAMEKDRGRRYADAASLRDDLDRFLNRESVKARYLGPARRGLRTLARHRRLVAAVTLIVCLATLLGLRTWNSRREGREAAERTIEAAEVAASRGLYSRAGEMLEDLRRRRPGHPHLAGRLAEYRKRDLHDRLMQFMLMVPSDAHALAGEPGTDRSMGELLDEARRLDAADVLADEFRLLDIVWMWYADREAAARDAISAWEHDAGGPSRATFVLGRLLDLGFSAMDRATELPQLDDFPAKRSVDLYATAFVLTLTKEDVPRGLAAAEAYLDIDPSNFWARNMRAIFLRESGQLARAHEVYSSMIDLLYAPDTKDRVDGKVHFARYKRGNVASLASDYAAAWDDFEACRGAIAEWRINRASAHCSLGLGDPARAVELYSASAKQLASRRKELAALPGLTAIRREASLAAVDRHLADVLSELIVVFRKGAAHEQADACLRQLGGISGFEERAAEFQAVTHLERCKALGGMFFERPEAWKTTLSELERLAQAWPDNTRIAWTCREAKIWGVRPEERAPLLKRVFSSDQIDDVERLWRAQVGVSIVANWRLYLSYKVGLAESDEEMARWEALDEGFDEAPRELADDLSYLREIGFEAFKTSLDVGSATYLRAMSCLFVGEFMTAKRLFDDLLSRPGPPPIHEDSLRLHRADAMAGIGSDDEAIAVYMSLLEAQEDMRLEIYPRITRIAARRKDEALLGTYLLKLEKLMTVPAFEWELARPAYDGLDDFIDDLLD